MINLIVMATLAGAPVVDDGFKLQCPAGTRQVRTDALVGCQETSRDGIPVFHGPFVSLYASGAVEAVGQSDHGLRTGKWSFYDARGALVGETEFKRGSFDGRRVFYSADGKVKSEERYLAGRLVAPVAAPDGIRHGMR